jgi:hypothetical protein
MPPMPSAMPVGQFGATGPSRMDSSAHGVPQGQSNWRVQVDPARR